MNSRLPPEQLNQRCPQCNSPLRCGLEQGDTHCWCFELPTAAGPLELSPQARCLCRECLAAQRSRDH